MKLPDSVKQMFAEHGRQGGKSKSPEKLAAALANLEKACEARWKKSFKGKIAGKRGR